MSRLGRWCASHRWLVIGAWVAILIVAVALGRSMGGETSLVFEVPGAESQQAFDLLEERFPQRSGDTTDIVFAAADVRASDVTDQVSALIAELTLLDHVDSVSDPYANDSRTISQQATVGFATVQFDQRGTELPDEVLDDLKALVADANTEALQVEAGGRAIQFSEIEGPGGRSERIGLAVAIIVLLCRSGRSQRWASR